MLIGCFARYVCGGGIGPSRTYRVRIATMLPTHSANGSTVNLVIGKPGYLARGVYQRP